MWKSTGEIMYIVLIILDYKIKGFCEAEGSCVTVVIEQENGCRAVERNRKEFTATDILSSHLYYIILCNRIE